MLGGYQNLSTFHTIIGRLSEGKIRPRRLGPSLANVIDFMRRYQRAYPVEIETTFGLDRDRTDLMIEELIHAGKLTAESVGNGRRLSITDAAKVPRLTRRAKHTTHRIETENSQHTKVEQR